MSVVDDLLPYCLCNHFNIGTNFKKRKGNGWVLASVLEFSFPSQAILRNWWMTFVWSGLSWNVNVEKWFMKSSESLQYEPLAALWSQFLDLSTCLAFPLYVIVQILKFAIRLLCCVHKQAGALPKRSLLCYISICLFFQSVHHSSVCWPAQAGDMSSLEYFCRSFYHFFSCMKRTNSVFCNETM